MNKAGKVEVVFKRNVRIVDSDGNVQRVKKGEPVKLKLADVAAVHNQLASTKGEAERLEDEATAAKPAKGGK
jgi:hypothetical protein